MFNKSNFCHIASNNRNEQKGSVFIYKTSDSLAQVTESGYFNEKLIDINLHDLIIHVQYNPVDRTLKKSVLIVTERTLDNVETTPILDQTIGDDIDQLGDQVQGIEEKIPGTASAQNQLTDKSYVDTNIQNLQNTKATKATDFQTPITSTNKGATMREIEEVITSSLVFKGYVSTTEPAGGLVEGNLWINSSTLPTTFPVPAADIKRWDGSAWVAATESYTPIAFDSFRNDNDNEGYYWFGGEWVVLSTDLSTEYFVLNQTSGKWEIKSNVNLPGKPTVATPTENDTNAIANVEFVKSIIAPGIVAPFAGTTAPAGWLKCDGSAVSRTTYADLFAVIGTTFGSGDGSTTFNLPTQSVLPLGLTAPIVYNSSASTNSQVVRDTATNNAVSSWQPGGQYSSGIVSKDGLLQNETNDNVFTKVNIDLNGTHYANIANATGAKAIVCIKY